MNNEHGAVYATIEQYFDGHATQDGARLREAFLPTACIEGHRQGALTRWTLDDYCAQFTGTPAADEATRERRIDWIEVIGDAASVRATLIHGDAKFTDYFLLLKVDERWRIASKVYHRADV